MVKEIVARIEDFCRGGKFLKKRLSRLIWVVCETNLERQVVRLH